MMERRVVVVPGPAYRPPAYRPPSLDLGRPDLGQNQVKFRWENIGQTILFGSIGGGVVYGSTLLPDPVKTVGMVAGIGLLGYAAYSFLGTEAAPPKTETAPGKGFRIPTKAEFDVMRGQFLKPESGADVGFNWFSNTYDVDVQLSNPNPVEETVTLQLLAHEQPYGFGFIPLKAEDYIAVSRTVILQPHENLPLPTLHPEAKTNRWVANLEVTLTLRILRTPGEYADLDHVTFRLRG